ncbi:CBO0543 family protein [Metabacillus halosaccharovorans]|uniref:Uncharacterized protein n=1 Tax=Metabacillus halosaccharovorans TaxID=930124 RepID=A0ABT3DDP0_9BACI|nr:CBO0543 family protein [Metabacillus halosaccharovorans]MCV9884948.1 hypothetical protein [Metabacillus halosaccharovorans]
MDRLQEFDNILYDRKENTDSLINYWVDYSNPLTWQFWILIAILLVPLIILYFKIDRSKVYLIGFFGYNVHVFFTFIDIYGINRGYWHYPYQVIPALPSISFDTALVPVAFMLIYQWTLNHQKNYYIYAIIMAAIFAFILKPLLVNIGLFRMYGSINYFHLFIGYIIVLLISKCITWIFHKLYKPNLSAE